jgi:tRNA threonylcarbamoyladenosine biosynthesis protein TsaB
MALILNLETATKSCSVCLARDGKPLAIKEAWSDQYSHAEQLNQFIETVMQEANFSLSDLDAVAVSAGPGSYTGLRIGTSTAKGICYALEIPLISVNSLKALASLSKADEGYICPMFDARRMEVYAAIYDKELNTLMPTAAVVVDDQSFKEFFSQKVTFLGPGYG